MHDHPPVTVTRIANACTLIELREHTILTDPFFLNWPQIGIREEVAMTAGELPRLTAIIGCHAFIDHWQMKGLADYPHDKRDVQVFVPMKSMARAARKVGFTNTELLQWGDRRFIGGTLGIEAVQAQTMLGWRVNNYLLSTADVSVFFGGEARDLAPLREYRAANGPVDVAVLPTNGVHLGGVYQLVMNGEQAVHAAQILGARQLFVIHDWHPDITGVIRVTSSGEAAEAAAAKAEGALEVVRLPSGAAWSPAIPTPQPSLAS